MDDIQKSGVYAQSLINIHGFDMDPMVKQKGFTLIEILIVVSILGIMAAIIMPEFHGHSIQAKEVTAKEMLQMLRGQVELYTIQHNGIPPGYLNGNISNSPLGFYMVVQLTYPTNINSQWNATITPEFKYGPYMNKFPKNPFNEKNDVYAVSTDPKEGNLAAANATYGWLYHAPTKSILLNTFGNDSTGLDYQDY